MNTPAATITAQFLATTPYADTDALFAAAFGKTPEALVTARMCTVLMNAEAHASQLAQHLTSLARTTETAITDLNRGATSTVSFIESHARKVTEAQLALHADGDAWVMLVALLSGVRKG